VEDQVKTEHLAAIRQCADRFHEILSAIASTRMIRDRGHKMTGPLYDSIAAQQMPPAQIERIAADGFEALVMILADFGDPDVTIHECNPSEHEQ
jgi:hypothetical protein